METDVASVAKQLAEDPNLLQRALTYAVGALSGLSTLFVAFVWRQHNAEMTDLKTAISSLDEKIEEVKKDVETDLALFMPTRLFEQHRSEMRSDISDLHRKIEGNDRAAQTRHETLMQTLLNMSERRSPPRN